MSYRISGKLSRSPCILCTPIAQQRFFFHYTSGPHFEIIFSFYVSGSHKIQSISRFTQLDHFSGHPPWLLVPRLRARHLSPLIRSSCSLLVCRRHARTSIRILSDGLPSLQGEDVASGRRCLSRCLIRSAGSSAVERRNAGSAAYTGEKVSAAWKILDNPFSADHGRDVFICIGTAVKRASIWDGSRLFTTGEQKRLGVVYTRGWFLLCFEARNPLFPSVSNQLSHCLLKNLYSFNDNIIFEGYTFVRCTWR